MSLTVVSTPIGNFQDITLRAIETLKNADAIICEEIKPARVLLKRLGIDEKELFPLNEHSQKADLKELLTLCREKNIALISDCGTPGFCDPGSDLVAACAKEKIIVDTNPGASSLMALISLCGEKLDQFYFVGFPPAEKSERYRYIQGLRKFQVPIVVMDTPYRLKSTLHDFRENFGERRAVLGMDLTGEKNQVARGTINEIASKDWPKAPFVLLIMP
jgi:16S rRNA (cytidine1402-2'-O)-methyltransferase